MVLFIPEKYFSTTACNTSLKIIRWSNKSRLPDSS